MAEEFQLEIPDAAAFSVWSSRSRRDALLSMLRCGPASAVSPRPRRFGILPRCGPASTSVYWRSPPCGSPMVSLRPGRTIPSPAFDRSDEILYLGGKASANITPSMASQPGLSIPGQSFGRSDATLSRVGKSFALTLPDCRPLLRPCSNLRSNPLDRPQLLPWRPPLLARERRARPRASLFGLSCH